MSEKRYLSRKLTIVGEKNGIKDYFMHVLTLYSDNQGCVSRYSVAPFAGESEAVTYCDGRLVLEYDTKGYVLREE